LVGSGFGVVAWVISGARGIDHFEIAHRHRLVHPCRHTVGREHRDRALGYLVGSSTNTAPVSACQSAPESADETSAGGVLVDFA